MSLKTNRDFFFLDYLCWLPKGCIFIAGKKFPMIFKIKKKKGNTLQ